MLNTSTAVLSLSLSRLLFYPSPSQRDIRMVAKTFLCALVAILPAALGFVIPAAPSGFATGGSIGHVSAASEITATAMRPTMNMERSYIMVKPDGVQRG